METRSGVMVSAQVAKMGAITGLATANFAMKEGFNIKNDGDSAIELEVKLWKSDTFIKTRFDTGWNPEIIREIKKDASLSTYDLKWGN